MARLLADIQHPGDLNFLRHLLFRLRDEGHELVLVCLQRGRIPEIMRREFPAFHVKPIGQYARSRIGLYLRTGLLRELQLATFMLRYRPQAVFGAAIFQVGLLARLLGIPSIALFEDPEDRLNFGLTRRFTDRFVVPECTGVSGPGVVPFCGLREWAYLSPRYFKPHPAAPAVYGLRPREYIFIRDVDVVSFNYRDQVVNNIERLYKMGLSEEPVILSLENKRRRNVYAKWRILEEPVDDIHSLMYHSRMVISSGDSMAREGAQLGVAGVYCGQRIMRANRVLIDLGYLHHLPEPEELLGRLGAGELDVTPEQQSARRQRLLDEWDDPTEVFYRNLMELLGS